MNVSLTPQLEDFVKQKVEAGLYNSVSEVMREALRLLVERDVVKEMKLEALCRDLQEGISSLDKGEGTPLDMDEIKAKARAIKEARAQVLTLIKAPQAEADLIDIWLYVSEDHPINADKLLECR